MSADMAAVVAQLLDVRNRLAKAAVTALRAQTDAVEAHGKYEEAGKSSNHRDILAAVTNIRTAGEKAGKVARLLGEAEEYIVKFINTIAPGSATSTPEAMPSGEELVAEAAARERRASRYHRKATEAAANNAEKLQKAEKATTEVVSMVKDRLRPGDTQASVFSPAKPPVTPSHVPKSSHPVADAVLAAAAVSVAVRAITQSVRKRRERKRSDDDQPTNN